jgi:phospholipase/carboxylesterase
MDTPKQTDLSFIHRFVPEGLRPRAASALHGSGGDEHDLLPLAERIGAGHAIVSPRGKVERAGHHALLPPRARRRLGSRRSQASHRELADFVRSARGAYGLPKPVVLGYSNGANIGWSLLLQGARRARRRDPVARHAAVRSAPPARSERHPGAADRRP